MKTILVAVVGTVGLAATPAVAGSKKPSPTKPSVEQKRIAEADATKPAVAHSRLADAAAAKAVDAPAPAVVAPAPASELLDIPELPADTSNAFTQLAIEAPSAIVLAPAKKAKPEKAPVLDLGDHYVLGGHKVESTAPREEVQQFVPRGLSDAQVSTVVQKSSADLQVCWAKLPAAQRADRCTAMMKLSIDDAGKVTAVEVGGDVPASTHACITSVVKRWQFPTAETSTVAETGVSMRSL
ncbi:MAG: hypothetical protein HOV81_05775 [Kofleriaceae bacterium]|nr:hypothetical protein [Kofleriaceae bacterium]